jgi:hypothetical protein
LFVVMKRQDGAVQGDDACGRGCPPLRRGGAYRFVCHRVPPSVRSTRHCLKKRQQPYRNMNIITGNPLPAVIFWGDPILWY